MATKPYQIGKPFDIEELKQPVRPKVVSPRDQELEKAITQAAAGAASQLYGRFTSSSEMISL